MTSAAVTAGTNDGHYGMKDFQDISSKDICIFNK